MRRRLLAAALAGLVANPAWSATLDVKDDRFEALVSAQSMTRIYIEGEKIAQVRKLDEGEGPQMLVEAEPNTGDVYVGFDGEVEGRSFTVYLITVSGRTVQAQLKPVVKEAETVALRLPRAQGSQLGASIQRSDRRSAYLETVTALVRVMFNGEPVDGVRMRPQLGKVQTAGGFDTRIVNIYEVAGLRGLEVRIRNRSQSAVIVAPDVFLVAGVAAVGADRDQLGPGEVGRIFIVEDTSR